MNKSLYLIQFKLESEQM
jgi:hypothetical protein